MPDCPRCAALDDIAAHNRTIAALLTGCRCGHPQVEHGGLSRHCSGWDGYPCPCDQYRPLTEETH
jgi:hypothetical protein